MHKQSIQAKPCVVNDCLQPAHSMGRFCNRHSHRWYRYGDPEGGPPPRVRPDPRAWILTKVLQGSDCWEWTGSMGGHGYGTVGLVAWKGSRMAHRAVYELLVGPIPEGMDLDHLCHNRTAGCFDGDDCRHRRCVNPEHLTPTTRGENVLRGFGICAQRKRRTACKQGHPYTPENTGVKEGYRVCLACKGRRWRVRGVGTPT